jgi:hypothetical protein
MPITILALHFLTCYSTNWLRNCESIATTFRSNHHTCASLNTILPSTFNAHQHNEYNNCVDNCACTCKSDPKQLFTTYELKRVVYFTPTFPNSSFKLWLQAPLFQPHPKEHSSSQFLGYFHRQECITSPKRDNLDQWLVKLSWNYFDFSLKPNKFLS